MAAISTASLPDIVFMLLFFFMVTTVMRETELKVELNKHPKMNGLNLSSLVSTKKQYKFDELPHKLISSKTLENKSFKPKILVIDFGAKKNILRHLVYFNADVVVLYPFSKKPFITLVPSTTTNIVEPQGIVTPVPDDVFIVIV